MEQCGGTVLVELLNSDAGTVLVEQWWNSVGETVIVEQ